MNKREESVKTAPLLDKESLRQDATRLLGEHAAAIIHELRAPLAGISMQLQLLEKQLQKDGYTGDCRRFRLIQEEISHTSGLCEQILALSSGREAPLRLTNVSDICRDSADLLNALAVAQGSRLQLLLDADCPLVLADEIQIRRVIISLVSNAVSMLAEPLYAQRGEIKLLLKNNADHLQIIVQDNGPGIEPQNLCKIFEPFFTTRKDGHGLGLYLCQQIALRHGGNIEAKSEPGQGCSFIFCLPVAR